MRSSKIVVPTLYGPGGALTLTHVIANPPRVKEGELIAEFDPTQQLRQFLTESVLISVGGGLLGIGFGFFLAWPIARTAEWKTIVTTASC